MIERDIVKALIQNDENEALAITLRYGLENSINTVTNTSASNLFFRLISKIDKKIDAIFEKNKKEFKNRSIFIKSLSKKLSNLDINHVFFKGAAYSINFYQEEQDRPYNDYDILINIEDVDAFYSFLNAEKLHHKNNYKYIDRLGYTRTALEVIKPESNIPLDFHYRLMKKFHKSFCPLTTNALSFTNEKCGIMMPRKEILIASTTYHCLKQSGFNLKIINLVDLSKLLGQEYDKDYLHFLLKESNTFSFFIKIQKLINNILNNDCSDRDYLLINKVFHNEIFYKMNRFSFSILHSQIAHAIDPIPYLNYAGGDITKNKYLELLKIKLKRYELRKIK